jgi:uncharacterized membrane protein YqaE (UPF0057 family)
MQELDFSVILGILVQFAQLAGVSSLLAAVVNVAKYFGAVADGQAGRWYAGLSLLGMGLLVYFRLFVPTLGVEFLDVQAGVIANILLVVLGYVMQLRVGSGTAETLKELNIPVVGASHTEETLKSNK